MLCYAKDGALLALGALSDELCRKRQYKAALRPMLQAHVFPELGSAHGFMRLRACWVYGEFARSLFAPPRPPRNQQGAAEAAEAAAAAAAAAAHTSFAPIFGAVLGCMGDAELPVRVVAALAMNHI